MKFIWSQMNLTHNASENPFDSNEFRFGASENEHVINEFKFCKVENEGVKSEFGFGIKK